MSDDRTLPDNWADEPWPLDEPPPAAEVLRSYRESMFGPHGDISFRYEAPNQVLDDIKADVLPRQTLDQWTTVKDDDQ